MTRFPKVLIAAAVAASLPATASADALPPRDGELDKDAARASAMPAYKWTAPDGQVMRIQLSRKLGRNAASVASAESLAALIATFHHSFELSLLKLHVVHPSEMADICGGEGILGCYGGNELVVPNRATSNIPLEEVLAHEYGHHLAAHRRNSLGAAIEWGPQAWSSTESICWHGDAGQLFQGYWDNPGEAFAEAYARLHYPNSGARWEYAKLLKPNRTSLEAIVFDAHHQLSRTSSQTTFQGSLNGSRRTQTFTLDVGGDTSLRLALKGPAGADYDVRLKTPGYYDEVSRASNARDRMNTVACFADGVPTRVKIRVTRHGGSGPFALTASYFDAFDEIG